MGDGETQRRKYSPWSNTEREAFLQGLTAHGKDLRLISTLIQSKNYPQTRDYFYRMLKKVKSVLGSKIDHNELGQDTEELVLLFRTFLKQQDSPMLRNDLLRILNTYRDEKEENRPATTAYEDSFVPGTTVYNENPQALVGVGPLKFLIKLFPLNESVEDEMKSKGLHPLLALSVGDSKRLASIATHLNQKWGMVFGEGYYIRLYPKDLASPHPGWCSETDSSVRVGTILPQAYSSNNSIHLEYNILPPSIQAPNPLDCLNSLDASYTNRNYLPNPDPMFNEGINMNLNMNVDANVAAYQAPNLNLGQGARSPLPVPPSVDVNGEIVYLPMPSSSVTVSDFAPSRDGFETGQGEFQGECRRFWDNSDRSLDAHQYPMTPAQQITPPKSSRTSPAG